MRNRWAPVPLLCTKLLPTPFYPPIVLPQIIHEISHILPAGSPWEPDALFYSNPLESSLCVGGMWSASARLQIGKPCPPDGQAWNPGMLIKVRSALLQRQLRCKGQTARSPCTMHRLHESNDPSNERRRIHLWEPTPCPPCPPNPPKQACSPDEGCGATCSCPTSAPHCVAGRGQTVGRCSTTPLLGGTAPPKRAQRFPAHLIPNKPSLILANYCKQPVWPALVRVLFAV